MSDMIRFLCDGCGKRLEAPPEIAGRSVKCICGRSHLVPEPEPIAITAPDPDPLAPNPESADNGYVYWIHGKSSRTVRLWCKVEDFETVSHEDGTTELRFTGDGLLNMQRQAAGKSTLLSFQARDVVVDFPPRVGRHVVVVPCPRCGKSVEILVQVDNDTSRKREGKRVYLPLTLVGTALFWVAAWFIYQEDPGWPSALVLVLVGLCVHLFPAACIVGLVLDNPGFSGRVANLLPAKDQMKDFELDKVNHHSICCVKGSTPDYLSWDKSTEEWLRPWRTNMYD